MNIPKSILVFGSSSAYGKNDIEGGGFAGRLRHWHEEINIQNKTYNLGIPGASIDMILDRVDDESSRRNPDFIILQLGCNDVRREINPDNERLTSLPEFQRKFAQLLEQLKAIAPTIVISNYPGDETKTTPVGWRDVYFFAKDIAEYETEMESITLRAGLDYIDIYGQWSDMNDYREKYISEDGLHANSAGHEYIFEQIRDKITVIFEEDNR